MVACHRWTQWTTCWVVHQHGVGYLQEDSTQHLGGCGCLRQVVLGRVGILQVWVGARVGVLRWLWGGSSLWLWGRGMGGHKPRLLLLPPLFSLLSSPSSFHCLRKKKNLVIKDDNVRSPIPLMLSMGILLYVKHLAVLHLQTPPAWRTLSREVSSQKTSNTFLIISYSFVNIC